MTNQDQTFCNAVLFTDMLEKFLRKNIKNSHFQAVLMIPVSALYAYPEPTNHHLKLEK
jgi:hypothetical protein